MNTENLYINDEQFFKYCEENRLLDDTQIEVLKLAAVNVDHIFLDYFIPVGRVNDMLSYCYKKRAYYVDLGAIAKAECYQDFIEMLRCLSYGDEEY